MTSVGWAQVCGGYQDSMTRCAQLLDDTVTASFVDVNVGCPIDLICNKCVPSGSHPFSMQAASWTERSWLGVISQHGSHACRGDVSYACC